MGQEQVERRLAADAAAIQSHGMVRSIVAFREMNL